MPKRIPEAELEKIKQVVSQFPGGVSVDTINIELGKILHRRTLQRRLKHLVEKKEIVKKGSGPSTRYRIPVVHDVSAIEQITLKTEAEAELYVPLSIEGEKLKEAVSLPVQQRQSVGYNQDFINLYQPNKTYYLPKKVRQHLFEIGHSMSEVSPAGTYALQIFNRLLIDLTWNSSRLEGNTYSLLETVCLIEKGESAEGKEAFETQMILNHKAVI